MDIKSIKFLKCSKCGSEKHTNPINTKKMVERYGTVEALMKGYVCRSCRNNATEAPAVVSTTGATLSNPNRTYTLTCVQCNRTRKTQSQRNKVLIEKFGSWEEVLKKYTCRTCSKKANKEFKKNNPVKKKQVYIPEAVKSTYELPQHMKDYVHNSTRSTEPATPEQLRNCKGCFRPDLYLDNGNCSKCWYFNNNACGCQDKIEKTKKQNKG